MQSGVGVDAVCSFGCSQIFRVDFEQSSECGANRCDRNDVRPSDLDLHAREVGCGPPVHQSPIVSQVEYALVTPARPELSGLGIDRVNGERASHMGADRRIRHNVLFGAHAVFCGLRERYDDAGVLVESKLNDLLGNDLG